MSIKTQEMNRQHPDDIKEIAYLVLVFLHIQCFNRKTKN